jgi:hypothetical protein
MSRKKRSRLNATYEFIEEREKKKPKKVEHDEFEADQEYYDEWTYDENLDEWVDEDGNWEE